MKRFLAVFLVLTTGMATLLAVAPADALAHTPAAPAVASIAAAAPAVASTPGGFVSLLPTRLLDTRSGNGAAKASVGAGHTVAVQVTGRGGVPSSGVSAVVLNVTVVAPAAAGYVTVFGGGAARPAVSNLNFVRGQVVPNLVVAPVGADGTVDLYNGSMGSVQLLADVSGWFRTETTTPRPVTGVSATAGKSSVALRWVNPVDSSLTGVMIRRSVGYTPPASASAGMLVADVAKPTVVFTDSGLVSSTQYSYALFAHDVAPSYAAAATVTVSTTGADVSSIAGTVTDAGGTHHGLEVVGVDVVSTYTGNGVSTSTLSDGTWSVIGLAAGTYSVCFDGSDAGGGSSDTYGYVDQCYKNQPTVNTSTPVTVIAGATTTGVNAALAGVAH